MNIEYMKTSPDTMIVTKDDGKIEERNISSSNIDEELQLENDIEYITKVIHDLYDKVETEMEPFELLQVIKNHAILAAGGALVGGGACFLADTYDVIPRILWYSAAYMVTSTAVTLAIYVREKIFCMKTE